MALMVHQCWCTWLDWDHEKIGNNFVQCKWLQESNLVIGLSSLWIEATSIPCGSRAWTNDYMTTMLTSLNSGCVNVIPHMASISAKFDMVEGLEFDKGYLDFGRIGRLTMSINHCSN
jgi:hypothetical protein